MDLRDLSLRFDRAALEDLLSRAELRLDAALTYACGLYEGERLLAAGGCAGNTIRCLAVDPAYQGEALLNTVFSHLYTRMRQAGMDELFVYTKPAHKRIFQSFGFSPLAETAEAILLTSDPAAINRWLGALQSASPNKIEGETGAIVMNANPFTLGHRHVVSHAAAQCARLHLFVVETEQSEFPFAARMAMVRAGTADIPHVAIHAGGAYIISSATFPSYFLKDPSGAAPAHAALDSTLFATTIAPALQIAVRFAGEEPLDPLTALYNAAMADILPAHGLRLEIIPRLAEGGAPISASRVRALLRAGQAKAAFSLLPPTGAAYLQSAEGAALLAALYPR